MITLSEFRKEDYWFIKWPLLSLLLSLSLAIGLFFAVDALDTTAAAELRSARNDLSEDRDSVAKIEDEEATIIEYIGRYQTLEEEGIVADEDRLQFQEDMAGLRTQYSLFPVRLSIEIQSTLPLAYPRDVDDPGRPIGLRTSLVDISLPLLHEDDLTRLLGGLLDRPGLLQPLTCSLNTKSRATSFIYLAQHFNATCTLQWYTFMLPPENEGTER